MTDGEREDMHALFRRMVDRVVELQGDHYVWLPYRRVDRDSLEETAQDAQR